MSSFVLSREDLRELTGYRQPSKMLRWLKENGIAHHIGGDGWPKVIRQGDVLPKTLKRSEPNRQALMELQHGKTKKAEARPA